MRNNPTQGKLAAFHDFCSPVKAVAADKGAQLLEVGAGAHSAVTHSRGPFQRDLGVTAGPNFEVGRRTWTDIFDD